jgi:hypothetical protein
MGGVFWGRGGLFVCYDLCWGGGGLYKWVSVGGGKFG